MIDLSTDEINHISAAVRIIANITNSSGDTVVAALAEAGILHPYSAAGVSSKVPQESLHLQSYRDIPAGGYFAIREVGKGHVPYLKSPSGAIRLSSGEAEPDFEPSTVVRPLTRRQAVQLLTMGVCAGA